MKFSVVYQPAAAASTSPYRVRDNQGGELDWADAFLDSQRLRQLSLRSLRIYAYDLPISRAGSNRSTDDSPK